MEEAAAKLQVQEKQAEAAKVSLCAGTYAHAHDAGLRARQTTLDTLIS